jgi:23S rRNA (pseudouridine1915-N3)-methyltransferase
MRLRIVALGTRPPAWAKSAYDEYASRLSRDFPLELVEIKPEPRDRGRPLARLLADEAKRIVGASEGFTLVALDERGEAWSSAELAKRMGRWHDAGQPVAFAIGSADGLDDALKRGASARLALSAMTLPHALVRVLLAEQIYRAVSLLKGHPYHRQ